VLTDFAATLSSKFAMKQLWGLKKIENWSVFDKNHEIAYF